MDTGEQQMRFSDSDLALIKATFKGNDKLLKLLRKVFMPKYDAEAPLGQTVDVLWVGLDRMMQMSPQDREVAILSQIRLNNHLERSLIELQTLANLKEETPKEQEERVKKDSSK